MPDTRTTATAPASSKPDLDTRPPTDTKLCGVLVKTDADQAGKPCLKAAGHTGGHSSRAYTKVDTSVVTADVLGTMEDLPDEETTTGLSVNFPSNQAEKTMVDHVKLSHKIWTDKGKPANFDAAGSARKRYFINPEHEAAVRKLLRAAASYHGVAVRIKPVKKLTDGRHALIWLAVDKTTKKSKTVPEPTKSPASSFTPSSSTPVPGPAIKGDAKK